MMGHSIEQHIVDESFERSAWNAGARAICGVDEVGRGPLAGPVVAAAVVLDLNNIPEGLADSKALTAARREAAYDTVLREARAISVVALPAPVIDRLNIRGATFAAMTRAVHNLAIPADFALVDGNALPAGLPCVGQTIIKGDARSTSIAAASIVAKVTRDRMMVEASRVWSEYGFAGHKGYPTSAHRDALTQVGICPLHRRSFAPVRRACS